jgi:hypothetical protein
MRKQYFTQLLTQHTIRSSMSRSLLTAFSYIHFQGAEQNDLSVEARQGAEQNDLSVKRDSLRRIFFVFRIVSPCDSKKRSKKHSALGSHSDRYCRVSKKSSKKKKWEDNPINKRVYFSDGGGLTGIYVMYRERHTHVYFKLNRLVPGWYSRVVVR